MNKISATGRLGADCEIRYTASGDPIANFKLASDVGFGDKKTTNWFACTIFGKRGESIAPHLTKGLQVTVFGTLQLREWTTKKGAKQLSPDIHVDEIELQGGKKDTQEAAPRQQREQPSSRNGAAFDDEVPFAQMCARNAWAT